MFTVLVVHVFEVDALKVGVPDLTRIHLAQAREGQQNDVG